MVINDVEQECSNHHTLLDAINKEICTVRTVNSFL